MTEDKTRQRLDIKYNRKKQITEQRRKASWMCDTVNRDANRSVEGLRTETKGKNIGK